jgi:cyclopropane-fatty-acyl-phospholipid synthase
MLPPLSALRNEAVRAGLRVRDSMEFGDSYSQTLRRWHETFTARWDEVRAWASTTGSAGCGNST